MVINALRDLNTGVFDYLEIISPTDVDKRISYKHRILRRSALKKY